MYFLQYSTYQQLKEQKKSEKFFKVLYDRMKAAQQEIRSTVTVSTIDLGSKKKDEDSDLTTSIPKKRGKEAPMCTWGGLHCAPAAPAAAAGCAEQSAFIFTPANSHLPPACLCAGSCLLSRMQGVQ